MARLGQRLDQIAPSSQHRYENLKKYFAQIILSAANENNFFAVQNNFSFDIIIIVILKNGDILEFLEEKSPKSQLG